MARVLCALVVLAGLLVGNAATAGERDLVVGVEELEYFPIYAWRDGDYVGAAREILDSFARDRGYTLSYRPLPIKRLNTELMAGAFDLKFPDNPHWAPDIKQGRKVHYSKPVIAYVDGVMVRLGNLNRGLDHVRTLGTVSGFTPFSWGDRIRAGQVTLKENPRMDLLLRQAAIGHVDGAYVNVAVANHVLGGSLNMPGALAFDPSLPHARDHYMASTTTRPDILAEFNDWLAANARLVTMIKDRYGAEKGVE